MFERKVNRGVRSTGVNSPYGRLVCENQGKQTEGRVAVIIPYVHIHRSLACLLSIMLKLRSVYFAGVTPVHDGTGLIFLSENLHE